MSSIYLSNAIFMMIILTIIFLRIRYYITWSPSKKYTMIFIGMVELYVLMDALFMKELLGKSGNFLQFKLVVFFFYLVYVIMPYVWHLFMQSYMGINRSKKQRFAEMIPFILLVLMVLLSVPTGIVWRFSRNRTYIRGTFFGVFAVLNLFYYVYTFAQTFFILFMNNTKGVRYLIKSALFSAVPLIGILANTYIIPLYGAYPFQPYCLVIGALLSYLFMVEHQQDQMEFEHRKRLSKALELEKESTRKAKVAGEVKNAFLANMSHDIRTPMNAIIGFSDLLGKNLDNEEKVREYLGKIKSSGNILMTIIDQVLEVARIESGTSILKTEAANLSELFYSVNTVLESDIQMKGIHCSIDTNVQHKYAFCDKTKLQEIYLNIMSNAIKYTPDGHAIHVTINETNFDDKKARYVFVCEDTGIGMASEYLPHIFDEFSREHTATENKVSGTGLGLSIVKSFVELMNGRIHVESKPGKGTKFTVEIPLELASEGDICKKELPEQTFMTDKNIGKRILLAEDNELNAEIAMELLKEKGFLIDWVKDGQECFDKLEEADEGYYDLILMDIQMPILNGYDTTAKIRQMESPKKASTPIVAMTANSFDEDIEMTQKAGMNGFIAKPLDAEKMFTILKQSIVGN